MGTMTYLTVGGDANHGTAAAYGREMGDYFAEQVARSKPGRPHDLPVKRALDLSFAILGLLILAPVLIVIALFIRLDTRGPVVFRQTRGGLNGRTFRIYKFRTLCVLENDCNVRQVTYGDERVTRVGRFLRAWSLDELPQLFNVLIGEMSLV